MTERLLVDFFKEKLTLQQLAKELTGSQTKMGHDSIRVSFSLMEDGEDYQVKKEHLLKLCDAFLSGLIDSDAINTLSLGLEFSDYANWDHETDDGQIISDIIGYWSNPEINYSLTIDNFILFKKYLMTGENPFREEN